MKIQKISLTMAILCMLIFATNSSVLASDPVFLVKRVGKTGNGNGDLDGPSDVILVNNKYYVADKGNNRIEVFDENWDYVDQFGGIGSGLGQLYGPSSLYYNGSHIFVVESVNDRISIFKPDGNFVATFGSTELLGGALNAPIGITGDGEMFYVSCVTGGAKIVLFNATTLEYWTNFHPSQLLYPATLTVDENYLYVSDFNANNIIVLQKSTGIYQFDLVHADVDQSILGGPNTYKKINNYAVVGDYTSAAIKIYDSRGDFVQEIKADFNSVNSFEIHKNSIVVGERLADRISVLQAVANPYNLKVHTGDFGIIVSWDINQKEGATEAISYNVYRNNGSGMEFLGQTTTRSFSDISVQSGQKYNYAVEANSIIATGDLVSSTSVSIGGPGIIQTVAESSNDTSRANDGSFLSNLPIDILPVVFVLLMIPVLRVKYRKEYGV